MSFFSFLGQVLVVWIALIMTACVGAQFWSTVFDPNPFSDQFDKTLSTLGFGESVLRRHYVDYTSLVIGNSTGLDQDIARAVCSDLRGVHVLGLPFGAGKTTAVRRVLARLQKEEKISGVLAIENAYDVPDEQSLRYSVCSFLHLNPTTGFSSYLSDDYVTKPLVLLFDQFERAVYQKMMKPFIVSLAEESRLRRKFVVLLVVNDAEYTDAILGWNGGEKFSRVGNVAHVKEHRWSHDQLARLLDDDNAQRKRRISSIEPIISNREQFLRLAVVAGTPGFLIMALTHHVLGEQVMIGQVEDVAMKQNASWERFAHQKRFQSNYA